MMIHAYNELYLNDAQVLLATAFDYAINDCKKTPDDFAKLFTSSNIDREFEIGNPTIIAGKSGVEVAQEIIMNLVSGETLIEPTFSYCRTPEYWAGWALAYYQWYTSKRFKDIFRRIPLSEILKMYNVFHEMDLSNFVTEMDRRYNSVNLETKLKIMRESRGISQNDLSIMSGVKLRSIQLYEQKVNDIDKAQAQTIYKLSRALGCYAEDLLENPEAISD